MAPSVEQNAVNFSRFFTMGLASRLQEYGAAPVSNAYQAPPVVPVQPPPPPPSFKSILQRIIEAKKLQKYYPNDAALEPILQRLQGVNFEALRQQWRCSLNEIVQMAALSLYDIVIYADDSGSMKAVEEGTRIKDLEVILDRVTNIAGLFDDNGINIRFFNSTMEGNDITNSQQALALIPKLEFKYATPLGTNLHSKILKPMFLDSVTRKFGFGSKKKVPKPLLIFIITDGEPYGEDRDTTRKNIQSALHAAEKSGYGRGALAFQFTQVGRDEAAQSFLAELDDDKSIGDCVDCTSYYELEAEECAKKGINMTPELWLMKMMLGAVDPNFDRKD